MGQYYKAIILNEDKKTIKAHATSWDYQSGSKLMEHSWMLNDFVARVEIELLNNPQILVWAGDYADPEVDDKGNIIKGTYESTSGEMKEYDISLYDMCKDKDELKQGDVFTLLEKKEVKASAKRRYILNHDTKQFVDKNKMPEDKDGWKIHPLPLLVADGNNRGGGDYRENQADFDKVGIWKRNTISIVTRKTDIPKDFKEISVQFNEHIAHTQFFTAS